MMKLILLSCIWIAVITFLFTQLVLPLFTRLRFFWWFYPPTEIKIPPTPKEPPITSLDELEKEAEEKTQGYKEMMNEIHGVEDIVNKIKNKTNLN